MRELIIGNYEILDRIGAGGMGTVYKARHRRMKRLVALKVLPRTNEQTHAAVQRFQREVEVVAQLNHPNIVTAYDADEAEVGYYLVMELIDGSDLAGEVKTRGRLPVRDAAACILQAARALEYAHGRGIVHRDVKPANLLRDASGIIKVADLGLARFRQALVGPLDDTSVLTQSGSILGTVDFMPPEQALDARGVDLRGDVYSLGCTLFYLLIGRPPYRGQSLMDTLLKHRDEPIPSLVALSAEIPEALDAVFRKMVAKSPAQRQQTMSEVIRDLEACGFRADGLSNSTQSRPAVPDDDMAPTIRAVSVLEVPPEQQPTVLTGGARQQANPHLEVRPLVELPQPVSVPPSAPSGPPPSYPSRASGLLMIFACLVLALAGGGVWWFLTTPDPNLVLGTWQYQGSDGIMIQFVFHPDGTYVLAATSPLLADVGGSSSESGRFEMAGRQLHLTRNGASEQRFQLRVSPDELEMTPVSTGRSGTVPIQGKIFKRVP